MIKESLALDDVLLVPQYSEVRSRADVDVTVKINDFEFSNPIIPANMKTVTGKEMCKIVTENKGLAILHRFMPIEEQLEIVKDLDKNYISISVGVKQEDKDNIQKFIDAGIKIFCIDIAHCDSLQGVEMIQFIKGLMPNCLLIAGNVATGSGAKRLWWAGADIVKTGVGASKVCSTRIEAASGVGQLSALIDVKSAQFELQHSNLNRNFYFIADGGIKNAGDAAKCLCLADMVMIGSLFAGCDESPGQLIQGETSYFKEYVGSSTHKEIRIEGIKTRVPYSGKYKDVLQNLIFGIQSCCSYQGVSNLVDLKENPEFIKISHAGLIESHPRP